MNAVAGLGPFDAPMPAVDRQDALRRSLLHRATRDSQSNLTRMLAGFFLDGFPLDQEHLANVGKVDVRIERRTAPNAARLDAPMFARRDLDEIRGIALLEQQPDIAFQRGLVTLDAEMIMRLLLNQVGGQCALGQQGITRDVFTRDVTALKQRDRHADGAGLGPLVGALVLITTGYG